LTTLPAESLRRWYVVLEQDGGVSNVVPLTQLRDEDVVSLWGEDALSEDELCVESADQRTFLQARLADVADLEQYELVSLVWDSLGLVERADADLHKSLGRVVVLGGVGAILVAASFALHHAARWVVLGIGVVLLAIACWGAFILFVARFVIRTAEDAQ